MRILFDQGTPVPLRRALAGHEIATAFECGWGTLQNGELLRSAEVARFEAVVTTDQNLRYQQNLEARQLAILSCSRPTGGSFASTPSMSQPLSPA